MPKVLLILLLSVLLLSACRCKEPWLFATGDDSFYWSADESRLFLNVEDEQSGRNIIGDLSPCQKERVVVLDEEGLPIRNIRLWESGQMLIPITDPDIDRESAFSSPVSMYALLRYNEQEADTLTWQYQLEKEHCGRTDFFLFELWVNGVSVLSGSIDAFDPSYTIERPALTAIPPC